MGGSSEYLEEVVCAFDASVGDSAGVVPVQYFVGPRNDGVDDVMELGYVAGCVEVTEPPEGFKGAVVVLSKVEAVELLEGVPAGFEPRVSPQPLLRSNSRRAVNQ